MSPFLFRLLPSLGTKTVEVWECKKTDIMGGRLPKNMSWAAFAKLRGNLSFSGWQLAQAVVKADFLEPRPSMLPGLGFLLQADSVLDFSHGPNLRLQNGGASLLADVTQSSFSGRLAQGLSILFAKQQGYDFVAHLAAHNQVAAHNAAVAAPEKVADFVFENPSHDRMLLESKGSFKTPANDPKKVKRILKGALKDQVIPWLDVLTPKPTKGFAVYSCFREVGLSAPSALIFVDPPGKQGNVEIALPKDFVRRQNYSAWLMAMGLTTFARRLRRDHEGSPQTVELLVFEFDGLKFAGVAFLYPDVSSKIYAIAIELKAVQAISNALRGDNEALINYRGISEELTQNLNRPGSLMLDGTYFGPLPEKEIIGFVTFEL